MIRSLLTGASCLMLAAAPGHAQEEPAGQEAPNAMMARCAQIESDAARLACFDLVMRGDTREARRTAADAARDQSRPAGPSQGQATQTPAGAARPPEAESAPAAAAAQEAEADFGRGDDGGFSLPGLPSLPSLPDFGRGGSDRGADLADAAAAPAGAERAPETQILERGEDGDPRRVLMIVDRISTFGYNTKRFHMANGQVWEVTDGMRFSVPRNADPLTAEIRVAGAGGYFLRLEGEGRAIRVRRID